MKVPLTNQVSGGSLGSSISATQGTQGIRAAGSLAQTIGNVSQKAFETNVKLDRIEQNRNLNNLKSSMKSMTAEYQNELITNKDSTSWQTNYEEKIRGFLGDQNIEKLSPEAREEWDQWHVEYSADQHLRIGRDATLQGIKNAELDLNNNMRTAEARGDFEESTRLRHESGLFTAEELAKGDLDTEERYKQWEKKDNRNFFMHSIDKDAKAMLNTIGEKDANGDYVSYNDQMTIEEREYYINKAKAVIKKGNMEVYDNVVQRVYSGDIVDPADIDALGDSITPKMKHFLKRDLINMSDEKRKIEMNDPTYQQELIGRVNRSIGEYDPSGEAGDDDYAEVKSEIMGMSNKYLRDERIKELDSKRDGKEKEIKDISDWMKVQAEEDIKAGAFGKVPEVQKRSRTLRDHINDGFYDDSSKLIGLGFTEKQVKRIQEASEEVNQNETWWDESLSTDEVRTKIFQEEWKTKRGDVTEDQDTLELVEKLLKVKSDGSDIGLDASFSEYDDPDSMEEAQEKQKSIDSKAGALQIEIDKYIRANKGNLNMKDAADFLRKNKVNIEAGDTDDTWKALPKRVIEGSGFNSLKTPPPSFKPQHSSTQRRKDIMQKGGATVLLDSNWKSGDGITSPLVVIPNNATSAQKRGAQMYVDKMVEFHKGKFGRTLKPRVVTRKENGRGRAYAIHTEGFAVTDTEMVKYLQTEKGKSEYLGIINSTLGKIPGVEFNLPHSSSDPGAVHNGVSEVDLAKWFMKK